MQRQLPIAKTAYIVLHYRQNTKPDLTCISRMKNVLVGAMMDIILGTQKIIGFVRTEKGKNKNETYR